MATKPKAVTGGGGVANPSQAEVEAGIIAQRARNAKKKAAQKQTVSDRAKAQQAVNNTNQQRANDLSAGGFQSLSSSGAALNTPYQLNSKGEIWSPPNPTTGVQQRITQFSQYADKKIVGSAALFGNQIRVADKHQSISALGQNLQAYGAAGGEKGGGSVFDPSFPCTATHTARAGDLNGDQAIQQFANLDPSQRANIEYLMWQGGFYNSGTKFVPGAPASQDDINAFKALLTQSVVNNQPVDALLKNTAQIRVQTGQTPDQIAAQLNKASLPADMVSSTTANEVNLRNAFATALGRNPTKAEMDRFNASYTAQQVSSFNAQHGLDANGNPSTPSTYNVTGPTQNPGGLDADPSMAGQIAADIPGGGPGSTLPDNGAITMNPAMLSTSGNAGGAAGATVQAPPTAAEAAAQFARTSDPTGFQAHQIGERANDIYSALVNSPAGNIPTTQFHG